MTTPAVPPEALLRWLAQESRLTIRQRRLLILVAQGFTHREIASRLGCARSVVGQSVARAMRHLRCLSSQRQQTVRPGHFTGQGPRERACRTDAGSGAGEDIAVLPDTIVCKKGAL